MAPEENRPGESRVFQFSLRHLFILIFLHSVYFALVRLTGAFFATILIGPWIQVALIVLLRIESMVWGAIAGTLAAFLLLVFAAAAFSPVPLDQIIATALVYPIVGYLCGVVCTADRQLRLGL